MDGEVFMVTPDRKMSKPESFPEQGTRLHLNCFEVVAALVISLSTLSGGIMEGYTSPAIPTLMAPNQTARGTNHTEDSQLYITEEGASWLGSLLLLGACVGSFGSNWIMILGRRRAVLASALPRILGWILIAAAYNVPMMYAGRFLCGLSIGLVTSAAPVYVSEISHSSVRGMLSCVVQIGLNTGIFITALVGTFLAWRALAIFGVLSVVIYFLPTLFIPNSPVWLVKWGREEEARTALRRLRGPEYCVEDDLQVIITNNSQQKSGSVSWNELFSQRSSLLPMCILLLVTFVNRFSGYNAIIAYCTMFINQAVPSVSSYWAAAGITLMQVVSTLLAAVLVDHLGRRFLLLTSTAAMGLSLITISIVEAATENGAGGSWISVLATVTYVSAYSMGVGPLTWVLLGELFPMASRDKAGAFISILNWGAAFLVTKTYFRLGAAIGLAGTCLLYGCVCIVGFILMYFIVPETKGQSLAEIEAYFTYSKQPAWKPNDPKNDQSMFSILDGEIGSTESYSTFQ